MTDLYLPPQARGADALAGNLDDSVFNRLLKERIIFLGSEVNDQVGNRICAQLAGRFRVRRHGDLRHHAVRPE